MEGFSKNRNFILTYNQSQFLDFFFLVFYLFKHNGTLSSEVNSVSLHVYMNIKY